MTKDPAKSIGTLVKDIYGRELGVCIGYTVDLVGKIWMIGVEQGSTFTEYPSHYISAVDDKEMILMPEWKAESRRVGMEKGILEKRIDALSDMYKEGEISRKVHDEMQDGLMEVRSTHEQLSRLLVRRLQELEANDDRINSFSARVKMHGASGEIGEKAVKLTSEFCAAMKSMNDSERSDIGEILDLITEDSRLREEHLERVDQEVEEPAKEDVPMDVEEKEEEKETGPPIGTLRSLGSSRP